MTTAFHPEVDAEIREAVRWYGAIRVDLREGFRRELRNALNRIESFPLAFPRWADTERHPEIIRKAAVRRFPYLIPFEILEDAILILAVAHARRRPLYWLARAA